MVDIKFNEVFLIPVLGRFDTPGWSSDPSHVGWGLSPWFGVSLLQSRFNAVFDLMFRVICWIRVRLLSK